MHGGKRKGAGRKPKKGKKLVPLTTKISEEMDHYVQDIAEIKKITRSELMRNAITAYIKREKKILNLD